MAPRRLTCRSFGSVIRHRAMQSPPSVYVSELSRRGLARRRARIRRRSLLRRLAFLAASAAALAAALVERAAG
jgi:hypothetical protein